MNFSCTFLDGEPFVELLVRNQFGYVDIKLSQKVIRANTVFILHVIMIKIFL